MRKPNKTIREITRDEFRELPLPKNIPIVYLVKQFRGRAYPERNYVTIPEFATLKRKGDGYLLYYIAHELSHLISKSQYHDYAFYKSFIKICPRQFQYFELHYKPSAVNYGIQ